MNLRRLQNNVYVGNYITLKNNNTVKYLNLVEIRNSDRFIKIGNSTHIEKDSNSKMLFFNSFTK